ncbi:hypothetical protein GIB67_012466 [Kingdonia uniflora]|uniref:Phytocyanin domain-containing protein n=1 Tax=Kingdonia uniflora TaxID=39325 RepID=A0A7J7MVA3_9MAGN|nr:hypothetical protein GIB67_012466 [Kingdonia uniflora]
MAFTTGEGEAAELILQTLDLDLEMTDTKVSQVLGTRDMHNSNKDELVLFNTQSLSEVTEIAKRAKTKIKPTVYSPFTPPAAVNMLPKNWDRVWKGGDSSSIKEPKVFTYSTSHSVDVVHKEDYDQCDTGDALQTYTGGNNTIALNKTGPVYFLCPALGHCGEGMKLAVTVSAATPPSPTPPSTPSPTPPSTPPPTPSTHAPPPPSGATSKLRSMDVMLVGAAILMALVLALLV